MKAACKCKNFRPGRRYQLRHAAGLYWLIDIGQSGVPYISPVPLNEAGAKLWGLIESGMSMADICEQLSRMYEVPPEQARRDVSRFIGQLQSRHVDLEELK